MNILKSKRIAGLWQKSQCEQQNSSKYIRNQRLERKDVPISERHDSDLIGILILMRHEVTEPFSFVACCCMHDTVMTNNSVVENDPIQGWDTRQVFSANQRWNQSLLTLTVPGAKPTESLATNGQILVILKTRRLSYKLFLRSLQSFDDGIIR